MLTPTVVTEFDSQAPEDTKTAMFGLGCFWVPARRSMQLMGACGRESAMLAG